MLLTSLTGKVHNVSLATKGKSRFYTTSVATKSLLGDTHSDAARRFIQQGRGVYAVLPGEWSVSCIMDCVLIGAVGCNLTKYLILFQHRTHF